MRVLVIGASIAMLRYHDFVPKPYLAFGAKLLRNGVDRRDVAAFTAAALRTLGPDGCESRVPGARDLIERYGIEIPGSVGRHDLSEADRLLGWRPEFGFVEFLGDFKPATRGARTCGSSGRPARFRFRGGFA